MVPGSRPPKSPSERFPIRWHFISTSPRRAVMNWAAYNPVTFQRRNPGGIRPRRGDVGAAAPAPPLLLRLVWAPQAGRDGDGHPPTQSWLRHPCSVPQFPHLIHKHPSGVHSSGSPRRGHLTAWAGVPPPPGTHSAPNPAPRDGQEHPAPSAAAALRGLMGLSPWAGLHGGEPGISHGASARCLHHHGRPRCQPAEGLRAVLGGTGRNWD